MLVADLEAAAEGWGGNTNVRENGHRWKVQASNDIYCVYLNGKE